MTDPVRRVHYYTGQFLSADDFQTEQDYSRRMRHLSNRLHGWGVFEGLDVTADDTGLVVSPGVAFDPQGREIVLTEECRVDCELSGDVDLWISWAEEPDAFVIGDDPDKPTFSRWLERPRVSLEEPDHPLPESVLLARVSRAEGGLALDVSARRTIGDRPTGA